MRALMVLILVAFGIVLAAEGRKLFALLRIGLLALFAAFWYYLFFPAIHICSLDMWIMVSVLLLEAGFLFPSGKGIGLMAGKSMEISSGKSVRIRSYGKKGKKSRDKSGSDIAFSLPFLAIIALMAAAWIVSLAVFSPLFRSSSYAGRIKVDNVEFDEIPEYSFAQTAIIDRDSAELLGDKVMGQMTDLVSQFSVSAEYPQISYKGASVRVTPLAYDGFIKYLKNRKNGVPGYIMVSSSTGKTELKRLDSRMRYVPSAYANENLYRRLHFQHPFTIFGSPDFEIDEEGKPWYICTTYSYSGLHSIRKVSGVILFDPVSGLSQLYGIDNVPDWVDRVYPADLALAELNDYGKYQKGFFNSIFGQEGVIKTSEGYNYLAKDGDIWLYTGMTSASGDDSNVGFVLVNLRTHKAQYTATPGASETAVMASAEGEVLNYGYTATFPTLINMGSKPFYLLSLKDSAGLVKMYCMVDAQDYQQVYTVKAGKDPESAIRQLLQQAGGSAVQTSEGGETVSMKVRIENMRQAVIDGNTYIYLEGIRSLQEDETETGNAIGSGSETETRNTADSISETESEEVQPPSQPQPEITGEKAVYVIEVTQANAKDALFLKTGDTIQAEYTAQSDGTYLITSFSY